MGTGERYTTTTTPETRLTKICTRRDETTNFEPCRTMSSTLRYQSESRGWQTHPWIPRSSHEGRQGEMAFCGHRGEHRVSGGQSPGHATTDDRASNHQSCRFVSHCRWSSHEDDSFLGCQESVFYADLNEVIYIHTGANLCKAGHCWWLRKALYGTHMASERCGVRRCEQ